MPVHQEVDDGLLVVPPVQDVSGLHDDQVPSHPSIPPVDGPRPPQRRPRRLRDRLRIVRSNDSSDLQARGLNFTDYTFLKESEERSEFAVRLWRTVRGSQLALYPNLNVTDPVAA